MIPQLLESIYENPNRANVSAYYDYIQDFGSKEQIVHAEFVKSCLNRRFEESKSLFLENKAIWFPGMYINEHGYYSSSRFHEFIVHACDTSLYYKCGFLFDIKVKSSYWHRNGVKLCQLHPIKRLKLFDKHPSPLGEDKLYCIFKEDGWYTEHSRSWVLFNWWFNLLTGDKSISGVCKYSSYEEGYKDICNAVLTWAKNGSDKK